MSTPVAEQALAARPEFLYLFRPELPPRPPGPEERAAYDHRYDFPEWRPVRALAGEGAALARGIIAAPRPADADLPDGPAPRAGQEDPAEVTTIIPADDMPTCLIPEVPA